MRRRLPSLHLLRIFEAAGRHQSFKQAAEELHVTPSAVSHQVKALEEQLGFALFRRGNRSLELTEAGRDYLVEVSRALDRLNRATERLMQAHGPSTLRLSVMPSVARNILMPRLKSFKERAPGVTLHIDATEVLRDVRHEQIDAVIRFGAGGWPEVHAEKLFGVRVTPMCSPGFAAEHGLDEIAALAGVPAIQMSFFPNGWAQWLRATGNGDVEPGEALWLDSYDACIQAAEQGHGVVLGVLPLERVQIEDGRLVMPFEQVLDYPAGIYLVCRPGEEERAEIVALRDWLKEQFE